MAQMRSFCFILFLFCPISENISQVDKNRKGKKCKLVFPSLRRHYPDQVLTGLISALFDVKHPGNDAKLGIHNNLKFIVCNLNVM
jgi:hypothetical protein